MASISICANVEQEVGTLTTEIDFDNEKNSSGLHRIVYSFSSTPFDVYNIFLFLLFLSFFLPFQIKFSTAMN